jgi:YidC/Oxa1 family membrane protein insertase
MFDNMSPNARLFLASIISALIILVWQVLYVNPLLEAQRIEQEQIRVASESAKTKQQAAPEVYELLPTAEVLASDEKLGNRIAIKNEVLAGSINLIGARIDDIVLNKYNAELSPNSPKVRVLGPSKSNDIYFVEFGWLNAADANAIEVPDSKTKWEASSQDLSPNNDLILQWTNTTGIKFIIKFGVDENYMFKVEQRVVNNSGQEIQLKSYALISKRVDVFADNAIIHEGPIAVVNDKLLEIQYPDVKKEGAEVFEDKTSWIGFSDKYWLASILPQDDIERSEFNYFASHNHDRFQASVISKTWTVASAGEKSTNLMVFIGAKELEILDFYSKKYDIPLFDRAVDFGALYFITKPIFQLLSFFYERIGNFGLAILFLTVVIKVLLFPLAHKGFKGMNRLKDLQPQMTELKERYADNPQEFQKSLLALYKKEKVNPMAGCLPILLQIPIFFALYKVLYVSIEMRHAPFFGWIADLSAPDPSNLFTLFGLLPWHAPLFLHVGILPILMALTMYIQQKLSPEPSDPTQAQVMKFLPLMFLFMFASFASGLVIYWTWSNVLSILQQVLIKRLEGRRVKRKI